MWSFAKKKEVGLLLLFAKKSEVAGSCRLSTEEIVVVVVVEVAEVAGSWGLSTEEIGAETVGACVCPIRMLHLEKFLFVAAYFFQSKKQFQILIFCKYQICPMAESLSFSTESKNEPSCDISNIIQKKLALLNISNII